MNEIIINKVKKENNVNSSLLQHDVNRWNVRIDHCSNVHRHRDGEYDAKTLQESRSRTMPSSCRFNTKMLGQLRNESLRHFTIIR